MFSEILITLLVIFLIATLFLYRKVQIENKKLISSIQSLAVKHGKTLEQYIPFLKKYPYDKNGFRFIGNPVDGIQFERDKIILVEFKTGNSRLSEKQKRIKQIVERGNVYFEEIKINE